MSQVLERRGGLVSTLEWSLDKSVLPGRSVAWLEALRREALGQFLKTGFPTQKNEAWRFTSLAPIADAALTLPENAGKISIDEVRRALSVWLPARMIFVDGFFSPELSALPRAKGITIQSLAAQLTTNPDSLKKSLRQAADWGCGLSHLSAALFQDGVYLHAEPKAVLDEPLQIAFLWSAAAAENMSHPIIAIEAEALSRMSIIEESAALGKGSSWRNRCAIISAAEGAQINFCQIQSGSLSAARSFETTASRVEQAANSRVHSHALAFGGDIARNDIEGFLSGEGAECILDGLYMARGHDHIDNQTLIHHVAPHCVSRELYKGVLSDEAQAVFRGVIEVDSKAQKTDAMVYNKNLLLSEKGWVNTKPEFRIFANDVQCKHGSTIGRLSEEAMFYLRSRGLAPEQAREFLIRAFAQETLDSVNPEALRLALSDRLGDPAGDEN